MNLSTLERVCVIRILESAGDGSLVDYEKLMISSPVFLPMPTVLQLRPHVLLWPQQSSRPVHIQPTVNEFR